QLSFTGTILTKMDGDARGGAALSINAETGKPVAFVGTGEKTSDLELFHPDRMANRILGMGDVVSLVEKAEATMDEQKAAVLAERLQKNLFTFTDFLDQLQQLRQMGPLDQLMQMVPGMNKAAMKGLKVDEDEVEKIEAIIYSMTKKEREHPEIIGGSRRSRIARGSGTTVQQINRLLKQFQQMKKMIKTFNNPKVRKRGAFPF
ncbi:MAG: signal recognition particle protein, partial [Candidatus Cloacimonetes bacterium]|nr:signal recognition particle protein [Candidatus Cloacimonadota bacterium]